MSAVWVLAVLLAASVGLGVWLVIEVHTIRKLFEHLVERIFLKQ